MTHALDSLATSLTGTAILFEALALGSSVAQRVERLVDDYHLSPSFSRWLCNGATNWVDYDLEADPRPNELPTEFLVLISNLSWLILVPPWWVEDGVDEGFDVVG